MIRSFRKVLTSALMIGLLLTVVNAEAKVKKGSKKPTTAPAKEAVQVVPLEKDTILVELKGSKITKKDLDNRIDKIPPMYKDRFKTVEGQKQVLDMLVQEELFYLEALNLNVPKNEAVINLIKQGIRPLYNEKYYNKEVSSKVNLTEEALKKYYEENKNQFIIPTTITIRHLQVKNDSLANLVKTALSEGKDFKDLIRIYSENQKTKDKEGLISNIRHNKYISGIGKDPELDDFIYMLPVDTIKVNGPFSTREETPEQAVHFFQKLAQKPESFKSFDEVRTDVETKVKFAEEQKIYTALISELKSRYNVVVDEKMINTTDFMQIKADQFTNIVVNSSNPELVINAKQIQDLLRNSYQMEKANVQDPKVRISTINKDLESRLIYIDALAKSYDTLLLNDADVIQYKRGTYLREVYNSEVVLKTVITEEDKKAYYEKNKKAFTEPAHKDIRQFVFKTEKEAIKIQKKVAKLVLKNKEDKILELLKKYSTDQQNNGLIKSVYNNDLLPGYPNNREYTKRVFNTKVNETSPVFKNTDETFVFFYIVTDYPEKVKSMDELKESIDNNTKRTKQQERFKNLLSDYKVKYDYKENLESLTPKITINELFDKAENAQKQNNYREAVYYYDQIIKAFPNGKDDYKAWFMKAFIFAEDLKDTDLALNLYEEMLKKWPNGELNDSAQFMIETLKGEKDPTVIIKD